MKSPWKPWLLLALFAVFSTTQIHASNVADFAFNYGSDDPGKIDDAKANNVFELVPAPGGGYVVRYLRLENFEGSKISTRAQETIFCYGEATYVPTLPSGIHLTGVTLQYVILDYQGQFQTGGKSWQISLDVDHPERSLAKAGGGAKKFYQGLPPWAQAHLHLISGYLDKNPGRPVLAYLPTNTEAFGSVVAGALSLAPGTGLIKGMVGEIVENGLKTLGLEAFREALRSDVLHRGFDYRVRDQNILKYKALYEAAGAKMWSFAREHP